MNRSLDIGSVKVVALEDGEFVVPPAMLFPDLTESDWKPHRRWLDAGGNATLRVGSFLVRDAGQTILVDSGLGQRAREGTPTGKLLSELESVGVAPADIDIVLTTHMHFDHVGGHTVVRDGKDVPTFGRATYIIREKEWDHWTKPEMMAGEPAIGQCCVPLADAGRLKLVGEQHVISPSLSYLETPGHTPGHVSVLIRSQGASAIIIGDVSHIPAQVEEPSWSPAVDSDRVVSEATRRALFERIEQEGLTMCAGHYADSAGIGKLVSVDGKRRWRGI